MSKLTSSDMIAQFDDNLKCYFDVAYDIVTTKPTEDLIVFSNKGTTKHIDLTVTHDHDMLYKDAGDVMHNSPFHINVASKIKYTSDMLILNRFYNKDNFYMTMVYNSTKERKTTKNKNVSNVVVAKPYIIIRSGKTQTLSTSIQTKVQLF